MIEAFPLAWPPDRPRTRSREAARFKVSLAAATADLRDEVRKLGGSELIISTNMPLRRDGLPLSRGAVADPGVAVYFVRKKAPVCFACDRWDAVEDNMRAVALTIGALRGIDRWGSGNMVERAFTGFTALPAPEQWWHILAVDSRATREQIEESYRRLASVFHPDKPTGDVAHMARINRARSQALEQFTN